PPTDVKTTGNPSAIASRAETAKPSSSEGRANMSPSAQCVPEVSPYAQAKLTRIAIFWDFTHGTTNITSPLREKLFDLKPIDRYPRFAPQFLLIGVIRRKLNPTRDRWTWAVRANRRPFIRHFTAFAGQLQSPQ